MKSLREHSKARSNAKIAKYMKGGSASNCYASGGTVKAAAAKKREDMPAVEGKAARPRLDRPGRKLKKRAEGGPTISANSKREIERIDREDIPASVGNPNALITGAGAGTALHFLGRSRMATPIRGLMGGAGLAVGARGAAGLGRDYGDMNQALNERQRIREGRPEPGKEDRKKGGRVKK